MPATIDQNLAPNAVVEFHTAKDHGKSESEAWAADSDDRDQPFRYDGAQRSEMITISGGHPVDM